jgi:polysaccharide export outer membrane protein
MLRKERVNLAAGLCTALAVCAISAGCASHQICAHREVPTESSKVSIPAYTIEPPDVLLIDAVQVVPRPPYHVRPLDGILIRFPANPGVLKKEDLEAVEKTGAALSGIYPIELEGNVNLGANYGSVIVVGKTVEETAAAVKDRLEQRGIRKELIETGKVTVELAQFRGLQQIRGEHLVRPDGTVGLGIYGSVYVRGLTLDDARQVIQQHLTEFLLDPEISLDVFAYNSKVYYVVTDAAGFGEGVYRLPFTGNETVLDAVSTIYGLPYVASKNHIWLARSSDAQAGEQCLPVDWKAITRGGLADTNYQVLPGDRIYVKADPLLTADGMLVKVITPIERIFGVMLLGNETVRAFGPRTGGTGTGSGF